MTLIIALPHKDGLVMASDLLSAGIYDKRKFRREQRKLCYSKDVIVGFQGHAYSEIYSFVLKRLETLFSKYNVEELLETKIREFTSKVNREMKLNQKSCTELPLHLHYLIGCNRNGNFEVWDDHGDGRPLQPLEGGIISTRGPLPSKYLDGPLNETVNIAKAVARTHLEQPEDYSGLEILLMRRDRTKRIAYKPLGTSIGKMY